MGVTLHTHHIRGESHIQCNTNQEVATVSRNRGRDLIRSECLRVGILAVGDSYSYVTFLNLKFTNGNRPVTLFLSE